MEKTKQKKTGIHFSGRECHECLKSTDVSEKKQTIQFVQRNENEFKIIK